MEQKLVPCITAWGCLRNQQHTGEKYTLKAFIVFTAHQIWRRLNKKGSDGRGM
jgi:hypothetical protein